MSDINSERVTELETSLAHLEHLVEQLNQVVVEQGRAITRLQAQQQQLASTVESQELERIKATSVKPPHYQ